DGRRPDDRARDGACDLSELPALYSEDAAGRAFGLRDAACLRSGRARLERFRYFQGLRASAPADSAMTSTVTIPLWLAVIVSALAIWATFERIIVPTVRHLLRRRFNRAIDKLNTRLKLRIQPFKLAKRQALIDQLIFDPEVLRAIETYSAQNQVSREAAQ